MLLLVSGQPEDAIDLSALILSSAPILLPHLLGDEQQALVFMRRAAQLPDGQYSASRHHVIYQSRQAIACMTLWHDGLPPSFHQNTLHSVKQLLSTQTLLHFLRENIQLKNVFVPPKQHELCIGHLAVEKSRQRSGMGKLLIEYAISQAKCFQKTHLVLDVDAHNDQALNFYAGLNFVLMHSKTYTSTGQMFHRLAYRLP